MARGGLNKVMLIGNLGRDPEIRYTASGKPVANFSMATTEVWNKKDGEREEKTEWHNIVAFGRLAEICEQYLGKGKQIYIEGRLQTKDWETREGEKRKSTEIIANTMVMLGRPDDRHQVPSGSGDRPAPSVESPAPTTPEEDDIPF
ncbi:single-stranded DNA-binding protein [Thermodesulfobacteriota bacterium]